MSMRLVGATLCAAGALVAAGCGSSSSGDDNATTSTPAATTTTPAATTTTPAATSTAATAGPLGPESVPLQTSAPLAGLRATNGNAIDGIYCNRSEQVAQHIHAHLAIAVDGKPRAVPLGIGIERPQAEDTQVGPFVAAGSCFYWLHTHASDGIVHVESPNQRTFTLGQFFDVWGLPLSTRRVGPAKGAVTAYVNGKRVAGDPRKITIASHANIQLEVGRPLVAPQAITFPSGL